MYITLYIELHVRYATNDNEIFMHFGESEGEKDFFRFRSGPAVHLCCTLRSLPCFTRS